MAPLLLAGFYLGAWWVFLPRFREDYGEERAPLLLALFVVAPFLFSAGDGLTRAMRKRKGTPRPQRPVD